MYSVIVVTFCFSSRALIYIFVMHCKENLATGLSCNCLKFVVLFKFRNVFAKLRSFIRHSSSCFKDEIYQRIHMAKKYFANFRLATTNLSSLLPPCHYQPRSSTLSPNVTSTSHYQLPTQTPSLSLDSYILLHPPPTLSLSSMEPPNVDSLRSGHLTSYIIRTLRSGPVQLQFFNPEIRTPRLSIIRTLFLGPQSIHI